MTGVQRARRSVVGSGSTIVGEVDRAEEIDRLLEPFIKLDGRFPAQTILREGDVRLPLEGVVLREGAGGLDARVGAAQTRRTGKLSSSLGSMHV